MDLYCGIGTIGLCLADFASHVYGIEIVKDAVVVANRNAVINGIVNATYTCGKAEELIPQWVSEGREAFADGKRADIAILDPPRAGCKPQLLNAIADASIPSIIYVSCDPATLARDVKLLREKGYELRSAAPVDMFPNADTHRDSSASMQQILTTSVNFGWLFMGQPNITIFIEIIQRGEANEYCRSCRYLQNLSVLSPE